jgi:hypothetical protein
VVEEGLHGIGSGEDAPLERQRSTGDADEHAKVGDVVRTAPRPGNGGGEQCTPVDVVRLRPRAGQHARGEIRP